MTEIFGDQSEWLTRKVLIDPKLKSSGWTVIAHDSRRQDVTGDQYAIAEYPTANGPADYVLVSGGSVVGIIEAKRLTLSPQGVLPQAERYARGLPSGVFDFNGLRAPFLY